MRRDANRAAGFYWVRFEGQIIVAEYTKHGLGCSPEGPHWHVPQSDECFLDREVCEVLSGLIPTPKELAEARAASMARGSMDDALVKAKGEVTRG